jgi:hypothetical protein
MPDIKIFVSHRIDRDTPIIEGNPLYVPMRCGTTYDKRVRSALPKGVLGDNTGDNISEKRLSYNEFTVQYWAWKNVDADYYGLQHYRRYLSFSPQDYPLEEQTRYVESSLIDDDSIARFGLADHQAMSREISAYDAIVNRCADIRRMLRRGLYSNSVYTHWALSFGAWSSKPLFREEKYLKAMVEIIRERYPQYVEAANSYLAGTQHRGYTCFVLRKELFNEMCELQFGVMSEIEARFDFSEYPENNLTIRRTPAYVGELLYGVFIRYLELRGEYRIKENQLVFFKDAGTLVKMNDVVAQAKQTAVREPSFSGIKGFIRKVLPSYRAAHRVTNQIKRLGTQERVLAKAINKVNNAVQPIKESNTFELFCIAQAIGQTHAKSFKEFEGCNRGRAVVILGSGPTLNHYKPIDNAVHIGVNRVICFDKVHLDYYFYQDWEHESAYQDKIIKADCVKFFARYCDPQTANRHQVPESFALAANARRYYSNFPSKSIYSDITQYPLMDFASVVFPAIHFALYTCPDKIYLVGCDVSNQGGYDGLGQIIYGDRPDPRDIWTDGYIRMREYASNYYPDTKIISINPVGLKGIFKDEYSVKTIDNVVGNRESNHEA